jgi:hypothetical protein
MGQTTIEKSFVVLGLAVLAGCSSTPSSDAYVNHFSSAKEDATHSKCMADHAMFNNRQLMVAPNAVESAWSHCVKQSDVWYPGKGKAKTAGNWEQQ